jgi:hypothetical protein
VSLADSRELTRSCTVNVRMRKTATVAALCFAGCHSAVTIGDGERDGWPSSLCCAMQRRCKVRGVSMRQAGLHVCRERTFRFGRRYARLDFRLRDRCVNRT